MEIDEFSIFNEFKEERSFKLSLQGVFFDRKLKVKFSFAYKLGTYRHLEGNSERIQDGDLESSNVTIFKIIFP